MPFVNSYSQSLRPNQQSQTSMRSGGHPLDQPVVFLVESPDRPRSRSSSRPLSAGGRVQLKGPARLFYDKASYTGVHAHGGPTSRHDASGAGELRPEHHRGSSFTRTAGHTLDSDKVRDRGLGPSTGVSDLKASLRPEQHKGSCFTRTGGHPLHADKVRARGLGPSSGGCDLKESLRCAHHTGSCFVPTAGHSLDHNDATHIDSMIGSPDRLSRQKKRRVSVGSVRELRGPERFFYDTSSYTGVHKNGGPSLIDKHVGASWSNAMRPGTH